MTVDVAPTGRTIVFDLLGHADERPIAGGTPRALPSGREWHRAPRYSPDGSQIAVVRDGAGPDEIWVMPANGGAPRQITNHSATRSGWVGGTPSWAPDGRSIVFGLFDTEANPPLSRIDLASGAVTPLETKPPTGSRRSGILSRDGRFLYFTDRNPTGWGGGVSGGGGPFTALIRLDLKTAARTILTDKAAGHHEFTPRLSPDGRLFAYIRRDREGRSSLRIRQLDQNGMTARGSDRELLALPHEDEPYRWDDTDERPAYAFTPDGSHVVIGAGGKIHQVSTTDGTDAIIPFTAHVARQVPPLARART